VTDSATESVDDVAQVHGVAPVPHRRAPASQLPPEKLAEMMLSTAGYMMDLALAANAHLRRTAPVGDGGDRGYV
jgi:hypothetical protein